uniref:Uncharacterized protein n=1 Tax=Ditylenchus dipsaci TaxID=166011 RepID=A0A915EJU7_9BILA
MIKCSPAAEVSLDGVPPCRIAAEGACIPASRAVPLTSGLEDGATSGFEARSGCTDGGSATCLLTLKVDLPKNAKEEGEACMADKNLCDLCPCVCLCDVSVLNNSPSMSVWKRLL